LYSSISGDITDNTEPIVSGFQEMASGNQEMVSCDWEIISGHDAMAEVNKDMIFGIW